MMKSLRSFVAAASGLALCALMLPASAQNPFTPPMSAMDELSGMSTGPSPGAYMPGPAGGAPANPFGGPQTFDGEPGMQPNYGAPPMGAYSGEAGYVDPGFGPPGGNFGVTGQPGFGQPGFGQPQPGFGAPQPGVPAIPKKTVVSGERFYDNYTRELLEEAMVSEVNETEVDGQYFDDGTHGDSLANDEVYANVTDNYDYVGQLTHKLRKRNVALLLAAEEIEPLEFFRLLAVTNDPLSTVNHEMAEEETRDDRIRDWNNRFLAFARMNPSDEKSKFHPLHVPRAPQPPSIPIPAGFDPRPPKVEEQGGPGGGTPGDLAAGYWEGEGGNPRGAASSRYF